MLLYDKSKRNASIPFKGNHEITSGRIFTVNLLVLYQCRKLLNDIKYFHCEFQKKINALQFLSKGFELWSMPVKSQSKTVMFFICSKLVTALFGDSTVGGGRWGKTHPWEMMAPCRSPSHPLHLPCEFLY